MKHRTPVFLLFLALLCAGCAKPQAGPRTAAVSITIPDPANPNAAELRAFAQAYAAGSDEARAAEFLLEHLPLADALSMGEGDLRENLEYAFLARRAMPWEIPWDIFLHYVLPHRASQEPYQPHRAMLFRELAPLCATAGSMEEALSRVGAWCAARAEYRPTSRRDLGVRSILDAGYGRCEETNILFMAAARAVGLPVRQTMVPWWQHADGNHAWVEAWTPQGWMFLESGTEFNALGRTWFAAQSPRMPKVAAHAYGHPSDPRVYRTGPGFALVDSTDQYTRGTRVRVEVNTADGQPEPGRDVHFAVHSLGGLRPVTKAVTDDRGQAGVILGPGTFFVSCAAGDGLAWTVLDTRDMHEARVRIQSGQPSPLPESLEFSFPDPAADSFNATVGPELRRIREERTKRWEPLLGDLPEPLRQRLALAGDRAPDWLRLLRWSSGPAAAWVRPLVDRLDDKDLLQAEPGAVPADIDLALEARRASVKAGLSYPDDMFLDFVLSPRLFLEPWSPWRAELRPWLGKSLALSLDTKVDLVRGRVAILQTLPTALFGPPLTPAQTHRGGFCASDTDKAVLATAALRALGVPARFQPDFGGVEYFDGKAWKFWKMKDRPEAKGTLLVLGDKASQPLVDFGVARIEDGRLASLDDLPWRETPDGLSCAVQPGKYALVSARREDARTVVRLQPFKVEDGKVTRMRLGREP
jgi:transglutaminase-like putative cysteine protease